MLNKNIFSLSFYKCAFWIVGLVSFAIIFFFDFWEFPYIYKMIGLDGLILSLLLLIIFPLLLLRSYFVSRLFVRILLFCMILPVYLFYADWTISEFPHSLRYLGLDQNWLINERRNNIGIFSQHVEDARVLFPNSEPVALENIMDRIFLSNPNLIRQNPIQTIMEISAENATEPALLVYWIYLASWYGEASAGKIPLFAGMTSETFRDFVQVHISSVFIESRPILLSLVDWASQNIELNNTINFKLKYLFHKATYDVSMEPYDTQLFSDILLVLNEYPQHFKELLIDSSNQGNTLDNIIRKNYKKISSSCLRKPYTKPYMCPTFSKEYYDTYRKNIISFSRAIFYKFINDFEFSTRVQSLIVKYYEELYKKELGERFWMSLSAYQQAILIAMLRDVYIPNVGKLSYNYYSIPEINCTPINFVVNEILANREKVLTGNYLRPWYPKDADFVIWGITGNKLKTLHDVWPKLLGSSFSK